jgi:hypothetical protein
MPDNQLTLERMTLTYKNISPFRLASVAQAERARYIRDELGGEEPKAPTYTTQVGGGKLPSGQELPSWQETHEYTAEHIAQLAEEHDRLANQPMTATASLRLTELRQVLAAWGEYQEMLRGLNAAVRIKRWKVGLWHVFGENLPDNDDWVKELEADDIDTSEIPTDERAKLVYWLERVAVSSQDEFNLLTYTVDQNERAIALVNEARLVARRMFQRALGEPGREDDR